MMSLYVLRAVLTLPSLQHPYRRPFLPAREEAAGEAAVEAGAEGEPALEVIPRRVRCFYISLS